LAVDAAWIIAVQAEWFIASASVGSGLFAVALALGPKEWIFPPRVGLLHRHRSLPDEISDHVVTKRIDTGETAAFVRLPVAAAASTDRRAPRRGVGLRPGQASSGATRHARGRSSTERRAQPTPGCLS
jgi:hypothetical protein